MSWHFWATRKNLLAILIKALNKFSGSPTQLGSDTRVKGQGGLQPNKISFLSADPAMKRVAPPS